MALYNSNVIPDYEVIHVLPRYFKVDDGTTISNPLNMTGSRIEVSVNIITAKKTVLSNIRSALKQINLEVDKFVLSAYANAIATLDGDQKKLGAAVINLGGTTSQFVVYKGSTVLYNDFLPVGSENITHDLVQTFHTPYSAANMIKKQYATLLPYSTNNENEHTIKKVKLPTIGNESESKEIALEQIQPVIHARVEETLSIIYDKLVDSTAIENIDGGVILTGGMTFIPGVKELASKIFTQIPVKVAHPKSIQNGYINFDTPAMTTIVGLLLYELESENSFELDSNCKLREIYGVTNKQPEPTLPQKEEVKISTPENIGDLGDIGAIKDKVDKPKKSMFSSMLDKFSKWI
jgi:cell division protein FtsA